MFQLASERVCIAGVVMLGALTLGRAQILAPASNIDSGDSESRQNSAPIFAATEGEYVISPDDELDVYVLNVPEISRQYRVSPAGLIEIPLLEKPISAAGLTPGRLSQLIGDGLRRAGMLDDPHVTVEVKESRLHY